ncbi:hypothetical protein [Sandaracinus amylolyticus]|uniref:hypothetical protein n=1 Tax=Sandaracinus amylolyticus TaxID=927083 RepID=UPI001F294E96|nr:hypothetical protein [Sandaracinus amylolyticus]UJR85849.1 Hypothetical protein I5071_79290 [Sandaracinus amylolyticus]
MPPLVPEMRAAHVQENLRSLERLGSDVAARVREAIGPESVAEIEGALRTSWLPAALDVALTGALGRTLGDEAVRRWSREALIASASTPLLRGFVATAMRTLGTSRAVLRWAPRAWDTIYRNAGELRHEARDDGSVVLVYEGPRELAGDDTYLVGIAGAFEGALEICGAPDGRFEIVRESARVARFVLPA